MTASELHAARFSIAFHGLRRRMLDTPKGALGTYVDVCGPEARVAEIRVADLPGGFMECAGHVVRAVADCVICVVGKARGDIIGDGPQGADYVREAGELECRGQVYRLIEQPEAAARRTTGRQVCQVGAIHPQRGDVEHGEWVVVQAQEARGRAVWIGQRVASEMRPPAAGQLGQYMGSAGGRSDKRRLPAVQVCCDLDRFLLSVFEPGSGPKSLLLNKLYTY
jgi:hypothetical protein